MMRAILHVDMDAYYSSVEQHDRPELKGLPVIVGITGTHGIVSAASYEVRRFGVRSEMRMHEALRRCPRAVCIYPRIHRYQEVSRQIFGIFREITPLVESVALDEAYLDVTDRMEAYGSPEQLGFAIKQRIRNETGLTASVGLSANKLLAKIASDLKKPDGMVTIHPGQAIETLDPLSVDELRGVGAKTAPLLHERGIDTFRQFRLASDELLQPIFGRHTQRMRERAAGIDHRPVVPNLDCKSISAGITFEQDTGDPAQLYAQVMRLAEKLCVRLKARDLKASQVNVRVRASGYHPHTRQHSFTPPTQDRELIQRIARQLLEQLLSARPQSAVRQLVLGIGTLTRPAPQLDLFDMPAIDPHNPLELSIGRIHERFGVNSIVRASTRL